MFVVLLQACSLNTFLQANLFKRGVKSRTTFTSLLKNSFHGRFLAAHTHWAWRPVLARSLCSDAWRTPRYLICYRLQQSTLSRRALRRVQGLWWRFQICSKGGKRYLRRVVRTTWGNSLELNSRITTTLRITRSWLEEGNVNVIRSDRRKKPCVREEGGNLFLIFFLKLH